jgi:hypothetical protein
VKRATGIVLIIFFPYQSFNGNVIFTLEVHPSFNMRFPSYIVINPWYITHTKHISKEVFLSGIEVYGVVSSTFTSFPGVLELTGA